MSPKALLSALFLASQCSFLYAEDTASITSEKRNPNTHQFRISLGSGQIDLRDELRRSWQLAIELAPLADLWQVQPALVLIDGGDDSRYLGVGILHETRLDQRWYLGFGAAIGNYDQGDSARDLGGNLEFLLRLTCDYVLSKEHRIRLDFGHLSNGSLGDINPGTELLTLNWVRQF